MSSFEKDTSKPGGRLLIAGIILYLGVLATGWWMARAGNSFAAEAIWHHVFMLVALPMFLLILVPTIFTIGTVTGTPLVSFTHGFAAARRAWRGVAGGILLLASFLTGIGLSIR